jgi:hypothetical protein
MFALPAVIGAMAYQNKAKVYGLLFKAAVAPRFARSRSTGAIALPTM